MKEFGLYLQQAREHAVLSLSDLHDRTRISLKNLKLIESGDFPSLPQTYVRAFVREYARAVGLDEEETLNSYTETAELEKGIPPPPASIDSSNLLPQIDDTIEYVEPLDRKPVHVEVVGDAEVEDEEDYVPPVRKSSYVRDDDSSAIDIRTSPAAPQPENTSEAKPPKSEAKPPKSEEKPAKEKEGPKPPAKEQKKRKPAIAKTKPPIPPQPSKAAEASDDKKSEQKHSVYDTKPPLDEGTAREGVASLSDESENDSPPPITRAPETTNEKRILGIGFVIIAILAIAVYGIFFFSQGDSEDMAAIDSTAIKASIEAGRFIDSSQSAMTEIDIVPEDTLNNQPLTPPEPVEAKPRVFEREDSLVLEAFTNAPVWFSIKMDTLRTERGSLSSNEHRVWRASDYFVITLGDAGAVTFFLNGKEIGTLGDEGAVVKNVTLSRRHIGGN